MLKINQDEIINSANHQINVTFITLQGESHLVLIFPMNLHNDEYAERRFKEVVKRVMPDANGQYYFELISNLSSPGTILDKTEMMSFEGFVEAINSILINSYQKVKNVFHW